jgi:hypothetical protein
MATMTNSCDHEGERPSSSRTLNLKSTVIISTLGAMNHQGAPITATTAAVIKSAGTLWSSHQRLICANKASRAALNINRLFPF